MLGDNIEVNNAMEVEAAVVEKPNNAERVLREAMPYLLPYLCDRDVRALGRVNIAMRDRVSECCYTRYRTRSVRVYGASGVFEAPDHAYESSRILQTAECVYRIILPPVMVPEQQYFLSNLINIKAKVRSFSFTELAVRLFRWHTVEYAPGASAALPIITDLDRKTCLRVRKCLVVDFAIPFLTKCKSVLEELDLGRVAPWTVEYMTKAGAGHFPQLRTLLMRFPYGAERDTPYLCHPEAHGNRQRELNQRARVRYDDGDEEFGVYTEVDDAGVEDAHLRCAVCVHPRNKALPVYYVHEACTPFGLAVCERVADVVRAAIDGAAPRLREVVVMCPAITRFILIQDEALVDQNGHGPIIEGMLQMLQAYPLWRLTVSVCRIHDNTVVDAVIERLQSEAQGRYQVNVGDCDGSCKERYNGSAVALDVHRTHLVDDTPLDSRHVGQFFDHWSSFYLRTPMMWREYHDNQ
ncbi:Cobalt-precorrin-5B C(1)-methyltransferase [Frankliniella fusca]|uniref:Cobalt-precorrin-5B C(1)-methyltransferase n=1 Tax=Frankliniella fusca TaxID=407009 RepID=A0AAE1LF66_9NEOP|nr:Cobalt-precorrin-5B C(1)-methyltransferase [Frankliniella fusca]KAK3917841.1 Cobalt-precorrin-5B C(1)-methyltransferase [Frankliniella fusca]